MINSNFNKILACSASCIVVFATTAANPHEVSYDSKWSDRLKTYQCSYYSCAWLKDMEKVHVCVSLE